jgi:hypothetical protein
VAVHGARYTCCHCYRALLGHVACHNILYNYLRVARNALVRILLTLGSTAGDSVVQASGVCVAPFIGVSSDLLCVHDSSPMVVVSAPPTGLAPSRHKKKNVLNVKRNHMKYLILWTHCTWHGYLKLWATVDIIRLSPPKLRITSKANVAATRLWKGVFAC